MSTDSDRDGIDVLSEISIKAGRDAVSSSLQSAAFD